MTKYYMQNEDYEVAWAIRPETPGQLTDFACEHWPAIGERPIIEVALTHSNKPRGWIAFISHTIDPAHRTTSTCRVDYGDWFAIFDEDEIPCLPHICSFSDAKFVKLFKPWPGVAPEPVVNSRKVLTRFVGGSMHGSSLELDPIWEYSAPIDSFHWKNSRAVETYRHTAGATKERVMTLHSVTIERSSP